MCTNLKFRNVHVTPGMVIAYKTLTTMKQGKFGLAGGMTPNVRADKLYTYWAPLFANRAVIEVDSFVEKGINLGRDTPIKIACIFDPGGDIAVITRESTGVVAKVHHRMPFIIEDEDKWLRQGELVPANSELQLVTS